MTLRQGGPILPLLQSHFVRLTLTIALPLIAFLTNQWLRSVLDPVFEAPFIAAVALVCWYCGLRWAIVAVALSGVLVVYFFLHGQYSLEIPELRATVRLAIFLGASALIVGLIASLHKARAELLTSGTLQRNLAELIPFGGWISDAAGNMEFLSDSFLAAFNTTIDECRGHGWMRFLDEDQRPVVAAEWEECIRSSYFWAYEYRMTAADGSMKIVLSRGVPVREPGGRIRAWVGIHLDITEREESIEERVRQARDIARFNAELEQLAWVSAHDLQEPLRIIASYLQLLQRRYEGKLDEEADEFIRYAVEGADRLRNLLSDLLRLQQIGTSTRAHARCALPALVDEAVDRLGSLAEGAEVRCGPLPDVICDASEFVELFQQLIGNALTYSRDDVKPQVTITADRTVDGWVISVADNGIGVEPEYLERIFNVFQRLHPRSKYSGTGIGLSICRKIVEVHGGRIWAESRPGDGTVFRFTLPEHSANGA